MSRDLRLDYNDLTSLPAGVFDALTYLQYVGSGESARVGSMCVGGGHARVWAHVLTG